MTGMIRHRVLDTRTLLSDIRRVSPERYLTLQAPAIHSVLSVSHSAVSTVRLWL